VRGRVVRLSDEERGDRAMDGHPAVFIARARTTEQENPKSFGRIQRRAGQLDLARKKKNATTKRIQDHRKHLTRSASGSNGKLKSKSTRLN